MRVKTALGLSALVALALVLLVGCDKPISGGACSPIGSTKTDDSGQLWTCAKNEKTGKGYWYKGEI